ncbi:MAG: 2,5-diamino-6-(ribosylamino)-4(3H)-pyrimidinone 5'-phosphate reductase [Aquificaceae bacterium]
MGDKKPYVAIVSGVSLDGKISPRRGVSSKDVMILPEGVQRYLHKLRSEFDAIMVGCNTIKTDNPSLTVRLVKGKNPIRIIPCSRADMPLDSNVLKKDAITLIATTRRAPMENIKRLQGLGVELIYAGDEKIEMELLMDILWKKGIKSLMVEGGAKLNWEIVKGRLVDEIVLFMHPVIFGSYDAPTLIEGEGFIGLSEFPRYNLTKYLEIEGFLISHWKALFKS